MNNQNIEAGMFVRGLLVGTKTVNKEFKKDGQLQSTQHQYLGIERAFVNQYNQEQTMVMDISISKQKQNDSAFMKSLSDNHYNIVELKINVGDFRNVYVDKDAVLNVLAGQEPEKKVANLT
ncbi:hypothetical protein [Thalassotalea sp. ND16A]|uniref:hypothetical protein n=1 Tax=Thalassotalea sp. ND16A TaxID=1535422 RepID=UPI00051A1FE8|nr:hypothetical protein [Thalassotalea sp. ND16A]KGK00282.1 hypothetical protein ND16A_3618 [Thalassotalea sp. ND16A]